MADVLSTSSLNTKQKHNVASRLSLLNKIQVRLEIPMLVLSFVWLILMILELTVGLADFLVHLNSLIWILFIIDYSVRFFVAPIKINFLRDNWLIGIALLLPALRLFRVFRAIRVLKAARAVRALRFARIITSLNRGISALGRTLRRRGFGYVLSLTLLVLFSGAAGILSFEKGGGFVEDYGTALWWTAMVLTTMGSDYFPKSTEGRMLCLILAIYGFAIFGYVTAAVATFFVGQDAKSMNTGVDQQHFLAEIKKTLDEINEKLKPIDGP